MLGQVTVQAPRRARRGFTMIELFVGVAIVAIILALGVPSLRNWLVAQRVASVATELVTDMRYARAEAISANVRAFVAFYNVGNGCYIVYRGPPNRGEACDCASTPKCKPEWTELKTVMLPTPGDVQLSTPMSQLAYETGSSLSLDSNLAATVTINGGNASRRLSVIPTYGVSQPTICAPAGSKIPGFKPC